MKKKNILAYSALCMSAAAFAAAPFNEARIYVNPGHGGWGSEDRNLVTINHNLGDTTGFYETNTDLIKGLQLYHDLVDNGAGKVFISRTKNGIDEDTEIDGVPQIVNLTAMCEDVEANNIDYFISIHSNAATEGTSTNYPLVIYRGTDAEPGNGLKDARQMGLDAWKYIRNNDITYKSYYTKPTDSNVRGDISFYGGKSQTTMGYTGYLGALRHGADGYLVEGCFHTYQPERHRLLNRDYCRQEGMRYARAIRAWFNGPVEKTGDIMGTVKNANHPLEHQLYKYKAASIDAYAPLNEVTVVLKDANGAEVGRYTTDKEYNGVFVFERLQPGKYTLDFTGLTDYHPYTEEIEVVAGTTVFSNVRLTNINEEIPDEEAPAPEVEYYAHPEQDGDIAAASHYNFKAEETVSIPALEGLTVRRALLRDGKYYILAHNASREPKLLAVNATDGSLVKELSLEGLVTTGFGGKEMSWTLSDIAFTNDGVLIGTNSVVIGKENNSYQNGDFYMYAWKGDETTPLEDQKPVIVTTLQTNTSASLAAAGNNNSNLMANSIAINGNFNDFNFYFDSHAGNGWDTGYGMRYVWWQMKGGERTLTQWNDVSSEYTESMVGEDAMVTLSPLGMNRLTIDGSKIAMKEEEVNLLETNTIEHPGFEDAEISIETAGANYFRYADDIFMVTPSYKADGNTYGLRLYNITAGLDKAELIGEAKDLLTTDSRASMSAYGVVRNADIDLYLMAGNKFAKVTTEGVEQESGKVRVFAYALKQVKENDAFKLSFKTNAEVDKAEVNIVDKASGETVLTIPATSVDENSYEVTVNKDDIEEKTAYSWNVAVEGQNVTRLTNISTEKFSKPYGVAVDNSADSEYFGRVYVTNTEAGVEEGVNNEVGMFAYDLDGYKMYSGNSISWTGTAGQGPRKVAVAADGRVFVCDYSTTNTGIYYIDPATLSGKAVFEGAVNDGNGSLSIGGKYVAGRITSIGVRGAGDDTQLFAVDATKSGVSWKKYVNRYDIGSANIWTAEPSESKVSGSYIGNENNSIVPVSTGYWAAQFRGKGSSSAANPCLLYYSDKQADVVYDSHEIDNEASQYGALAVDEAKGLIAQSYNGGIRVMKYRLKSSGIPVVEVLYEMPLAEIGNADSFAFDYAGNLYAVSDETGVMAVYAMPTNDNSCVTPANSALEIMFGDGSVEEIAETAKTVVYPNPTEGLTTVKSTDAISGIDVYSATSGIQVLSVAGNGSNAITIDLSDLATGIYFVKINGAETVKVIKK